MSLESHKTTLFKFILNLFKLKEILNFFQGRICNSLEQVSNSHEYSYETVYCGGEKLCSYKHPQFCTISNQTP